tara:strand:- start:100 stop:666 length:567 start_codon:yes stop_codon:yes gene_type:complete
MEVFKKHQRRGEKFLHKEVKALQLLEANFINEPEIDHYPFPRLINVGVCKEHLDKREQGPCYILTLTHCGTDTHRNARKNIQPNNLYNTVECIINNLRNVCLKHSNIQGHNVCINEKGQISLIDFDFCVIVNKTQINDFYKKPNLNELKNSLYTESFRSELKSMGKQKKKKEFCLRFKNKPWSLLYMF